MKILYTLAIIFSLYSCSNPKIIKEGLVFHQRLTNDSTIFSDGKTWFKDSFVIVEGKWHRQKVTINNVRLGEIYETYKYTFLNLKTGRAQDYFTFSDTATPLNNYHVKEGFIGWGFYKDNGFYSHPDSTFNLPDTIINHRIFKRWGVLKPHMPNNYYRLYGTEKFPKTIFHVDRRIEKLYPGIKIVRLDILSNQDSLEFSFNYKILRKDLDKNENKIFRKWIQNSIESNLPLITFEEAQKIALPDIQPDLEE